MFDPLTTSLLLVAVVVFLYLGPARSSRNGAAGMIVASMMVFVLGFFPHNYLRINLILTALTLPISLLTYYRAATRKVPR